MKALRSVLLLASLLLVLVGSPVEADDPPPDFLREELPLDSPVENNEMSGMTAGESRGEEVVKAPFDLDELVGESVTTSVPQSSRFGVATHTDFESDPVVALCAYDQYLVVYERAGEIYGQFVSSKGALVGSAFRISSGDTYADGDPDVACEWIYNRFIVVWTHDFGGSGDYDIYAQAVYGGYQSSGGQTQGGVLSVAGTNNDEVNPAIACNHDDANCLVTFEDSSANNGDIFFQRLSVGSAGISKLGDKFAVSNYSRAEHNPDVAWGGAGNNYVVIWQYFADAATDYYQVVYAVIYDTEQGLGAEERRYSGGRYTLINSGDGMAHNQTLPSIAYNRRSQRYLIAFQYDYYGTGGDYDIAARRLWTSASGPYVDSSPFYVVGSTYDELTPAVAYSGGPENLPGAGANQFLVAYVREGGGALYARAVKGMWDTGGVQTDDNAWKLADAFVTFGSYVDEPEVAGSVNNGRYMIVWQDHRGGFVHYEDIYGRMAAPYGLYLPCVLRNRGS